MSSVAFMACASPACASWRNVNTAPPHPTPCVVRKNTRAWRSSRRSHQKDVYISFQIWLFWVPIFNCGGYLSFNLTNVYPRIFYLQHLALFHMYLRMFFYTVADFVKFRAYQRKKWATSLPISPTSHFVIFLNSFKKTPQEWASLQQKIPNLHFWFQQTSSSQTNKNPQRNLRRLGPFISNYSSRHSMLFFYLDSPPFKASNKPNKQHTTHSRHRTLKNNQTSIKHPWPVVFFREKKHPKNHVKFSNSSEVPNPLM